jgi:hypothetical protein
MTRLGGWLVGFFFLLMLVVPTTLQAERGILLALLLFWNDSDFDKLT